MGKVLERFAWINSDTKTKSGGKTVDVPKHIEWIFWRLVVERIATLTELDTYYDLVEVLDAHTALNIRQELEHLAWEE